jgi:hypothetical protein
MGLHVPNIYFILFPRITPQVDTHENYSSTAGNIDLYLSHIYFAEHIELPIIKFWIFFFYKHMSHVIYTFRSVGDTCAV